MAREDVKKQIAIAVALFSIVSVILVLIGGVSSVSYTHLDVYKRQAFSCFLYLQSPPL